MQLFCAEDFARWGCAVYSAVTACAWTEGSLQLVQLKRPFRGAQGHDLAAPGEQSARQIGIVERLEDDHLVARLDEGVDDIEQGLSGATGDAHFRVSVDRVAVLSLPGCGDRLAQTRLAVCYRVLIEPARIASTAASLKNSGPSNSG